MTREGTAETGGHATFIVRITRADGGGLTALVERVRTGEKARVQQVEQHLGRVVVRMLEGPAQDEPTRDPRETLEPGENPGHQEESPQ